MTIKEKSAVVAYPNRAYDNMNRMDILQSYEEMYITDFEKLFETDDKLKFEKSDFSILVDKKLKSIIRHVAPFTRFNAWNKRNAEGSHMVSVIYTEPDGFPIAEYCAFENPKNIQIEFTKDLVEFYKKHKWESYEVTGLTGFLPPNDINENFPSSIEAKLLEVVKEYL